MSVAHLLEDFGSVMMRATAPAARDEEAETMSGLQMFEKGYKDGYDDALRAQEQSRSHVSEELARNLQDLSFTYHEAHANMVNALSPMMQQMVEAFLPDLARRTLVPRLAEELSAIAAKQGEIRVEIVVHPSVAEAVREMAEGQDNMPAIVKTDPSQDMHGASLHFGESETMIDFTDVLGKVAESISAFFEENRKDLTHD